MKTNETLPTKLRTLAKLLGKADKRQGNNFYGQICILHAFGLGRRATKRTSTPLVRLAYFKDSHSRRGLAGAAVAKPRSLLYAD